MSVLYAILLSFRAFVFGSSTASFYFILKKVERDRKRRMKERRLRIKARKEKDADLAGERLERMEYAKSLFKTA